MSKRNTYILELDDQSLIPDDIALLFFLTPIPGYSFVDQLNRLFEYDLHRIDDLQLHQLPWPQYHYTDPIAKLHFHLIEKPRPAINIAPSWAPTHKLLIIKGQNALQEAELLYDDFTSPPIQPDPTDLLATHRFHLLQQLSQQFIPVAQYHLQNPPPKNRKNNTPQIELQNLILDLIDTLDLNHQ